MKSILQAVYDGEVYPDELIVPKDPEYRPVNRKIGEEKEHFRQTLSAEEAARFEALDALCVQASSMNCYAAFSYGFRLAAALLIEAVADADDLARNG